MNVEEDVKVTPYDDNFEILIDQYLEMLAETNHGEKGTRLREEDQGNKSKTIGSQSSHPRLVRLIEASNR